MIVFGAGLTMYGLYRIIRIVKMLSAEIDKKALVYHGVLVTLYALLAVLDVTVLLGKDFGLLTIFFICLNFAEVACQSIVAYICVTMGS
jgi:hypothetical protein